MGNKPEPRYVGILVLAHDEILSSDQDIFVFWGRHCLTGPIEFQAAMRKAFTEWAGTPLGQDYVATNGCNWGDAISIPKQILLKHGIASFINLEEPGANRLGAPMRQLVGAGYDNKLIVDHNEHLVES